MEKYVFWSLRHREKTVVLNESLGRYAAGETTWQALARLLEHQNGIEPAADTGQMDLPERLKMFEETGLHKVEIFVEREKRRFVVSSAGVRCRVKAATEYEAIVRALDILAVHSLENRGAR